MERSVCRAGSSCPTAPANRRSGHTRPPWSSSWRHASTPPGKCPRRYNRWKRTRYSTPRTASRCKKPIMQSWRPIPHSWSDTFSSTQMASSVGFRSKHPTIQTTSPSFRPRRNLSPPRTASHTDRTSAQKRQHDERIAIDAGLYAHLVGADEVGLGAGVVALIKKHGRHSLQAGKHQLGLIHFLSQHKRLLVVPQRAVSVAVALVNLPENDQRHRQMVEQSELPVEIDRGLRCTQPLFVTALSERAKGNREIGVEARLETEVANFLRGIEPQLTGLNGASRVERRIQHPKIGIASASRLEQPRFLCHRDAALYPFNSFGRTSKPGEGGADRIE